MLVVADAIAIFVDEMVANSIAIFVDEMGANSIAIFVGATARIADSIPVAVTVLPAIGLFILRAGAAAAGRALVPPMCQPRSLRMGIGIAGPPLTGTFRPVVADPIAIFVDEMVADPITILIDEPASVANSVTIRIDETVTDAITVLIDEPAAITDTVAILVDDFLVKSSLPKIVQIEGGGAAKEHRCAPQHGNR